MKAEAIRVLPIPRLEAPSQLILILLREIAAQQAEQTEAMQAIKAELVEQRHSGI